ncbi:hypothetical protein [Chamaesiphon sp. VAR_48_metabat_135_sub]|uniref:hypothetical protein n=1 Tax=Chamaesiphon sp. VAR_48_metabat_135_sub TaxID=2964699 RepID=UPI00286B6AB2|nr:hypothetical protein [Chamaesiphon sp. VAR_48_metabat_135_sub]
MLKLVTSIVLCQIGLMTILVGIGIVLNLVAYRWMTDYHRVNRSMVELVLGGVNNITIS